MSESANSPEVAKAELEQDFELKTEFIETIDQVVATQANPRVQPISMGNYEGQGLVQVGDCEIIYAKYNGRLAFINGVPICGLEIRPAYGKFSASFVLTETNGWQREYRDRYSPQPMDYSLVVRQLDDKEIVSLIAFAKAPHLRVEMLEELMTLSEEEQDYLAARRAEVMEQKRELYEDLAAMSEARRRAAASSRDIIIT